ncbi:hypothetical protein Tco_0188915, partial [Tanacetum coccineum]
MNGMRICHGYMTSHGLIMEYGRNQHQSNTIANLSIISLDVQNGQPVVGERMVIVKEEICPVLTLSETRSITKTLNEDDDDESRYEQRRRWNVYTNYDNAYEINHDVVEREELCEIHEFP